jgi:hypothetical protein
MKLQKILASVLIIGVLSLSSFFVMVKPAAAYCVYNNASAGIVGQDTRSSSFSKYWVGTLNPNTHDCCPGDHAECQNATIQVQWADYGPESCEQQVDPHGYIIVTSDGNNLNCEAH